MRRIAALLALGSSFGIVVACGTGDSLDLQCVPPPCPIPLAIQLRVSSAAGGPVPGLTVDLIGSHQGSVPCSTEGASSRCSLLGYRGTYQMRIAATGFRTMEIAVVVPGTDGPRCGCPTIETQQVEVVLTPS